MELLQDIGINLISDLISFGLGSAATYTFLKKPV